jgi:RNA polymerase sigma factor (sigma-70 family)
MLGRLPNPLSALDDRALLARFAERRDQPAFEHLVKRHGALVLGVCRRAVRDRHLAEDAFQAVFLVLARDPARAGGAASVGGWLFGVARRVGLAARRRELRRAKRDDSVYSRAQDQGAYAPRSPEAQTDFDDLLRVLDEELATLPDEARAALVACFLEERTQDEAARELGWSLSTLRRRLEHGKELLRARLTRRGAALGVALLTGAVAQPARAAVPALAATPSPLSAVLAAEIAHGAVRVKLVALIAVVGFAVGGAAFALWGDPPAPVGAPAEVAPAPRRIEAPKWGTVSGRVVLPKDRAIPPPRPVGLNMKDEEVWKPFAPLHHEDTLVHANNRGIMNAVVFLRPDSDDRRAEFPAEAIHPDLAKPKPADRTVRAARGQFEPRVLAVRAGDRVVFDNQLPVPTNVRYDAAGPDSFNVLVGKGTTHATKPLPAAARPDGYSSTIYPWMAGWVWAFDHPYFAVTDANGHFEIPNAPAGQWRLVVWHERAGWHRGAPGRLGTPVAAPADLGALALESANWP